jgi:hypothetical protein
VCATLPWLLQVNRLGALRSDHDIFQTFEGDNTVLLQQVGRQGAAVCPRGGACASTRLG